MTAMLGGLAGGAAEGVGGSMFVDLVPNFAGSTALFAKAGSSMSGAFTGAFSSSFATNQLFHQMPRDSSDAFKSFGGAMAGSFVGAFKSAVSGQMPDVLKVFDSFEDSAARIFTAAGTLSGIGMPIVAAFNVAKPAFDAFKELGFQWIEMLTEIGDGYTTLERRLAATNLTPQIKGLSEAVRELAGSGAVANFAATADAIGQINASIQGLSLDQLKELTTIFTDAEMLVGKIDASKFSAIIQAFNIPAEQADDVLTHLVNTARSAGVPFNALADALARSGPTMKALGYDAEQTAGMFARLYATGPQGAALVGSLDKVNSKMRELVAEGKFTTARQGWETLIVAVQKFIAAGDEAGGKQFLGNLVGAENAPAMLEAIKSHVVDISSAISGMPGIGEKLSDGVEATRTLSEAWEVVGNQMRAALAPIGTELAHGLTGASTQVTQWLAANQEKIMGWAVNVTKTFTTGLSAAALFIADLLNFAAPVLEAIKDIAVWTTEVIINTVNAVLAPLSHLPGFQWARDAKKDLDALRPALNKAWDFNLPKMIGEADVRVKAFAQGAVPEFNAGLDAMVERFKTSQEMADAFGETINGKVTNTLLGSKDAQGNLIPMRQDGPLREVGGGYHLGGGPQNWDDVWEKLNKMGITLQTDAQGMITAVTFANEEAKKKWDSWIKEMEKNPKNVPIKLEPKTPGGQDARSSGDLVPEGQVPVTLNPSGTPATPTPSYPAPANALPAGGAPAGSKAATAQSIYNAVVAAGYSKETAEYAVAASLYETGGTLDPNITNASGHHGLFQESKDKPSNGPEEQIKWFVGALAAAGGPGVVNRDPKNIIADKVEIGGYSGSQYDAHLGNARTLIGQPAGTPGDPVYTAPAPGAAAPAPAPAPAAPAAPPAAPAAPAAPARRPPTAPAPTTGPQPAQAPEWAMQPNDPRLHHAEGGDISMFGAERGRDSIPAVLMPGEHVWTTAEVEKAGGQKEMYSWRAAVRGGLKPRFFGGGGQGAADYAAAGNPNDRPDLVDPQLQYVMQIANQMGLTLTAGRSGHGTHGVDGGWHDTGQAGDFGNGVNTDQELAFARYMFEHFGSQLSELIYSDPRMPKLIKDGKVVDPGFYGADTLSGHRDHVHVAIQATQPLSDAMQPGSQPLVPGTSGFPSTPMGSPSPSGTYGAGAGSQGSSGGMAGPVGSHPLGEVVDGVALPPVPSAGLTMDQYRAYASEYTRYQQQGTKLGTDKTDAERAIKEAQAAQQAAQTDYNTQRAAWDKLSPEAQALSGDQQKKLADATTKLNEANKALDKANKSLDDVNHQIADRDIKGAPQAPKGAAQKEDRDAASLGAGLVKGLFQELGLPDVFGKAFTQWGSWKAGMGVAGFMLNGLMGDQGQQAPAQGAQAAAGGALGALFPGLPNPAANAGANPAIPGAFDSQPANAANAAPSSSRGGGLPGALATLPGLFQPAPQQDDAATVVNAGSTGPTFHIQQHGFFLDTNQAKDQIRDAAYTGTAWTPSMSPPAVSA